MVAAGSAAGKRPFPPQQSGHTNHLGSVSAIRQGNGTVQATRYLPFGGCWAGSSWANTLVIVTGDHETGYLTAAPGVFPDQPLGAVTTATLALEKTIVSSNWRASWQDGNGNNEIDAGETVYWAWNSVGHSNSLIPLYAKGAGAELFAAHMAGTDTVRGEYVDNTAVFQVMDAVLPQARQFLPVILNSAAP
ncbi:MAG: hypothetical protein D6816_17650 [Bacteroidetes bacterium]|nr:MAG: hypothetical protein D6816_17650 [Bacteroidota bacterium]